MLRAERCLHREGRLYAGLARDMVIPCSQAAAHTGAAWLLSPGRLWAPLLAAAQVLCRRSHSYRCCVSPCNTLTMLQVPEIPLVVDDSAEGLKKTKGALALLVKVGAIADAEKAKSSRNIRCEVARKLTSVQHRRPDRAGCMWLGACASGAADVLQLVLHGHRFRCCASMRLSLKCTCSGPKVSNEATDMAAKCLLTSLIHLQEPQQATSCLSLQARQGQDEEQALCEP